MVTAPQLARRYDEYRAALPAVLLRRCRGMAAVRPFLAWVEECWRDEAPPEPEDPPDAVSAGGWGTVRWHETGATIRGYVPGPAGCYEVRVEATPPALWRSMAGRREDPATR